MTTREGNWLYTSTNRLRQAWLAAQRSVLIDERVFDLAVEEWPDEIDAEDEPTTTNQKEQQSNV